MNLPPADVLAAVFGEDEPPPDDPNVVVDAQVRALVPIVDQLRIQLADVKLMELHLASPEQRAQVVELRDQLAIVQREVSTRLDMIDMAFRGAAIRLGAKQIPAGEAGIVKIEPPRAEWKVDEPAMKRALEELVEAGTLTQEEVDNTITTIVTMKADNRRLNYLADNRGDAVREAIDAHRVQIPGNPMSAKLTFVRSER